MKQSLHRLYCNNTELSPGLRGKRTRSHLTLLRLCCSEPSGLLLSLFFLIVDRQWNTLPPSTVESTSCSLLILSPTVTEPLCHPPACTRFWPILISTAPHLPLTYPDLFLGNTWHKTALRWGSTQNLIHVQLEKEAGETQSELGSVSIPRNPRSKLREKNKEGKERDWGTTKEQGEWIRERKGAKHRGEKRERLTTCLLDLNVCADGLGASDTQRLCPLWLRLQTIYIDEDREWG